ncbi:MAG: tetratricopeptide repeat protein [Verrucomicrobiales bacterium]
MTGDDAGITLGRKALYSAIVLAVFLVFAELICLAWERFDPLPASALPKSAQKLPPRMEGEIRILCLGGSTVAGYPEPSVGFVSQLQAYLEILCPGRLVRLVNYAVNGQPSTYVVRKLHATLGESGADAVIVLTGHNEFVLSQDFSDEQLRSIYAIQESLYRWAVVRRAQRLLVGYYLARRRDVVTGESIGRVDRHSEMFRERVKIFQTNIDLLVGLTKGAGVPLLLCTAPANVADWLPSREDGAPGAGAGGCDSALAELEQPLGAKAWEQVQRLTVEALADCPENAMLHYAAGKAAEGLGQREEARRHLLLALDLDRLPGRTRSEFNDKIRRQSGAPGVLVVDAAAVLGALSPSGLPGWETMADACHPNPQGSYLIATALADTLAEAGVIDFEPPASARVRLDEFLGGEGRDTDWTRYLLTRARAAMSPQTRYYSAAEKNLKEAIERDPDNWEVVAAVATLLLQTGNVERGMERLRQAVRLKGSEIDLDDRQRVPFLKEALEAAGMGAAGAVGKD